MADIIPATEATGDIPAMAGAMVAMVATGVAPDPSEWGAVFHSLAQALAAEDALGAIAINPDFDNGWPPLSRDHIVYYALEPQLWPKVVKVCKQLLRTGSGLGSLITKPVAPLEVRVLRVRKIVYDMFARGGRHRYGMRPITVGRPNIRVHESHTLIQSLFTISM